MKIPADQLSDAELEALIALPALKQRESGGRPGVMGPQTQWGRAVGSTQMLPDTAKAVAAKVGLPWRPDLLSGTTPEAASYQDTLGHAYLTEGIAKTGSLEDGLRYYHGGPDRRQWGPKTEAYAKAVAANAGYQPQPSKSLDTLSNEELDALIAQKQGAAASAAPAPPVQVGAMDKPVSGPVTLGQMQAFAGVKPKSQAYGFAKGAVDQNVRLAEIAKSMPMFDPKAMPATAFSPGGMLANTLLQRAISAGKGLQGQIETAGQGYQPGKLGELAGSILGSAWVPGGIATQGAVSGAAQSKSDRPQDLVLSGALGAGTGWLGGKAIEGLGNLVAKPFEQAVKGVDLQGLRDAKSALYKQVENSGFKFSPSDMRALSLSFLSDVRAKGPKAAQLVPAADAFAARLTALGRQRGGVSLSQLDALRSDIYDDLISKGGPEMILGYSLRNKIDRLMDASQAPFIRAAREANTRFEKVSDVTRRLTSAELAAGRAHSGENIINATRQKLSPMLDPLHSKQVKNLTPDEKALLKDIIVGDKTANTLRGASKLMRNKFVSGAAGVMMTPVAGPMGGLALMGGLEGVGRLLNIQGQKYTQKQINDLLTMMSLGGNKAVLAPVQTATSQAIKKTAQAVARPMGLIGGTAAGLLGGTATAKPKPKPKK